MVNTIFEGGIVDGPIINVDDLILEIECMEWSTDERVGDRGRGDYQFWCCSRHDGEVPRRGDIGAAAMRVPSKLIKESRRGLQAMVVFVLSYTSYPTFSGEIG